MKFAGVFLALLLLLTIAASAARRHDPFTTAESDQLRAVASNPHKLLKLYIEFATVRLNSIERVRSDPKSAEGRGRKIHDLLEDFTAILDELNHNLDQYAGRSLSKHDKNKKEFHKDLSNFIAACEQFDHKLKVLKSAAEIDPQTKQEVSDFHLALQDAQDAVKSSVDVAEEYWKDERR